MEPGIVADLRGLVEGNVLAAPEQIVHYVQDYGQIRQKLPAVVVRPYHAQDVLRVVRYGLAHGLPVSSRGVGHSLAGQALNEGGIVLDMRTLNTIHTIDADGLWFCGDAGVLWRRVVADVTGQGLVPPVLTGYPHVSIGGTHAAGGWGTSSSSFGAQIDNCLGIEIVTGTGELLRCTREEHSELFYHALGGLGQFGIITKIWHKLRHLRLLTRTYTLVYDDLESFLADNELVVREALADYIDGTITQTQYTPYSQWSYIIRLTVEADTAAEIDDRQLVARLRFARHVGTEDMLAARFAQQEHSQPKEPRPGISHPWVVTFLPWSRTREYLETCLKLPSIILGGKNGPLHLWPASRQVTNMPMFRVPEDELMGLVGIFPTIPTAKLPAALAALSKVSDLGLKMGGTRHLATWVHFDLARWRLQFGDYWPVVNQLKFKYDPQGMINPGFIEYESGSRDPSNL